jgi:hypothetical protein
MIGIPAIFSRIFRLIAGIPAECKTWIEVGLSLSYQAKKSGKKSLKFRLNGRNFDDLNCGY